MTNRLTRARELYISLYAPMIMTTSYIYMLSLILWASVNNFKVGINFNLFGEGCLELVFFILGIPAVLYWFSAQTFRVSE